MDRIEFKDYTDFANTINKTYKYIKDTKGYNDIVIIAKFEDMRKIMKELITIGYNIRDIIFHDTYPDEHYCTISNVCGENEIWCEPFKRDGDYFDSPMNKSTVAFVVDNCSSKCLKCIYADVVVEVGIGNEEDCELDDYNSESTHISRNDKNEPDGFTKSWSTQENGVNCYSSYSYYSDNADSLKEVAKKFGVKL